MLKKIIIFLLISLFTTSLYASENFLESKVERYTLSNGMKFLLMKREGAPVFTGYIRVKVGGADEKLGETGIAHMLEHMAFKGTTKIGTKNYAREKVLLEELEKVGIELSNLRKSQNNNEEKVNELQKLLKSLQEKASQYVVKDEFSRIYLQNGASNFNATTSKDVTSYFVELPNSKLELWAYLESERLKDPIFREFYSERDVVMEERRMRVDDSPFGKNYENLMQLAFKESPYQFPTIGYAQDVSNLTATDLMKFYKTYYVPQNMVGAIIGDIDLSQTKKLLNKYFGTLSRGNNPPVVVDKMELQDKERRSELKDEAKSQVMIAYHKPSMPASEDFVFDVIDQILCEGRTSRLYTQLVEKKHLAANVSCDASTPGSRLSNLFWIYTSSLGKSSISEIEKVIQHEIDKLIKKGVSNEELDRARNQLISDKLFQLSSNLGLAEMLSYFEVITGDWHYLLQHDEVIQKISSREIQEVAKKYLKNENKSVSVLGH